MKALALVDDPDHVCCRYRIRAFEPFLRHASWSLRVEPLARSWPGRYRQFRGLAEFDTVILQRKLFSGWEFGELRQRGRRLVFDFDDAILYRDSYDARGPHSRRRTRRFARAVRRSDAVIAGNGFLAACGCRAGASANRVRVIPTCVDAKRYRPAHHEARGSALDLVWIGSSSTLQGLEAQRPLWDRLGREFPEVQLRVICDRYPDLGALKVIAVPWSEATEAAELAAGDVGISWIPDDLWSRGKCGLKVLQYQAAGLPVIANPVGAHAEMIEHGVTGFLATTPDEWVTAVRSLAAGPSLRRQMGQAARVAVESKYSVEAWALAFLAAVQPDRAIAVPQRLQGQDRTFTHDLVTPSGKRSG